MEEIEEIEAFGSPLIRSTHKTTFEITRDRHLTPRGDCIIAVGANKAARDLSAGFKDVARTLGAEIIIIIEAGGEKEIVRARGDPKLTFTHRSDIVVRRSSYICGRTVAIRADKAASDLSRRLVEKLRAPNEPVKIVLIARA